MSAWKMTTNIPSHWLNQTSKQFLDAHNAKHGTGFSSLKAHIFVFRGSEFLSIEETALATGHFKVPTATLPDPNTSQSTDFTIRDRVINELGQLMTSTRLQRVLRSLQFIDYFFSSPLLLSSSSSSSVLHIMVLTTINPGLTNESGELHWIPNENAMSNSALQSGPGVSPKDVLEAANRYSFNSTKPSVEDRCTPDELDIAHTRILEAIIAVRAGTGSSNGSILERKFESGDEVSKSLLLFQRELAQLNAREDKPPSYSFPGSTFARLGRWIDGKIEWTESTLEERMELVDKIKRLNGRIDVEWR